MTELVWVQLEAELLFQAFQERVDRVLMHLLRSLTEKQVVTFPMLVFLPFGSDVLFDQIHQIWTKWNLSVLATLSCDSKGVGKVV